ncbi:MAG: alpha/beta hydrolase [Thermoleophilia bacterium]|nr:alpha/beta hydrolase [Thermoleophilia bacterium]
MSWTTDSRHVEPHSPPTLGETHGSYFVDVDGMELHARVAAPPADLAPARPGGDVVLVHGLGVSSRYMVPLLEELGTTVRCWAPDLPGHGRSDSPRRLQSFEQAVDTLHGWTDAVGLDRPLLVANSWGCQLAVELARQLPVRGLLLIGPVLDLERRSLARNLVRLARNQRHEPRQLTLLHVVDYVDTTYRRTLREFRASQRYDLVAAVAGLEPPVVVARGDADMLARRGWCERVASAAGAPLLEVPDSGHCINTTRPREVAGFTLDLLARTRVDELATAF